MVRDNWRDRWRAAFFENIWLKILSLLVALGLYAFIHAAQNAQRSFNVSVVSIMPPEAGNRQLMTQLPTQVTITLRGSRTQLADLRPDELGSVQMNLRNGRDARIEFNESMFHIPAGLVVEQIEPAFIELSWDDVIPRVIPVQIARTGEPALGFMVKGAISVEPGVVNARGPASIVNVIQYARAAPFDVTALTEGRHQRSLALDKPPKLIGYDVESVVAKVEITRELLRKQFAKVKVEVVGMPRATTTPGTVNVVLTGTPEDIGLLSTEDIVARVELKNDGSTPGGSVYSDVLVELPRVKAEVQPPKVLVKW